MPLDMHMKIEGVTGEMTGMTHKGWSEIISWNWGMTSNRKAASTTENTSTSLNEISVVKKLGTDSTAIRLLFAQGTVIPRVEFDVIPTAGKKEAKTKYVNLVMENVVIKSIVTGGASEDSSFREHITFIFEKVNFECSKAPNISSGAAGVDTNFAWNVSDNAEWTA